MKTSKLIALSSIGVLLLTSTPLVSAQAVNLEVTCKEALGIPHTERQMASCMAKMRRDLRWSAVQRTKRFSSFGPVRYVREIGEDTVGLESEIHGSRQQFSRKWGGLIESTFRPLGNAAYHRQLRRRRMQERRVWTGSSAREWTFQRARQSLPNPCNFVPVNERDICLGRTQQKQTLPWMFPSFN